MKKKFFLMLLIAIIGLFGFVGCKKEKSDGSISVVVANYESEEVCNKVIEFNKDDTLLGLLQKDEDILLSGEEQSYGLYIKKVCNINCEDFPQTYWSIEVNGEYSMVGISDIPLCDKDVIKLALIGW